MEPAPKERLKLKKKASMSGISVFGRWDKDLGMGPMDVEVSSKKDKGKGKAKTDSGDIWSSSASASVSSARSVQDRREGADDDGHWTDREPGEKTKEETEWIILDMLDDAGTFVCALSLLSNLCGPNNICFASVSWSLFPPSLMTDYLLCSIHFHTKNPSPSLPKTNRFLIPSPNLNCNI